ncbi:MAG: hypothetical protein II943_03630 [Victivallales bacterium]|nr:hypothetical protein [Victivallales bacterium]
MTNQDDNSNAPFASQWKRGDFYDDYAIRDAKDRVVARPNCNLPEARDIAALLSLAPKLLKFVSYFASSDGEADLHLLDKYTAGHGTEIHNAATELLAEFNRRRRPESADSAPETPGF